MALGGGQDGSCLARKLACSKLFEADVSAAHEEGPGGYLNSGGVPCGCQQVAD